MGLFNSIRLGSSAAGDYEVERSLRFNRADTTYVERTPSSNGNKRTWTFSAWIKRGQLTSLQTFFSAGTNNPDVIVKFTPSDQFEISRYGGSYQTQVTSTQLFRDPSAWYHIVGAVDTTQATASNRVKMYVNGTQITDFAISSYPSQDYEYPEINDTGFSNKIGKHGSSSQNFDGYMTEINFIDGSQLDSSSFAETDAVTGEYKPKKYTGGYGTNGFYLNFSDNSGTTATTLGKDYSGNGNNFTPYNFVTGDAVKDSPTNNFCIMNIHDNNLSEASPHFVYSEGNLKAAWSFTGTNFDRVHGSLFIEPHDTNKYYWEMIYEQNNESMMFGVCATDTTAYEADQRNTNPADSSESNIAYLRYQPYQNAPYILKTDASSSYHGSYLSVQGGANVVDGDVLGFVFDRSTGKLYVFHNGNELTDQDYSNNTSVFDAVATDKTYAISLIEGDGGGSTKLGYFIANFGQDSTFAGNKTAQGNTDANGLGDFYHSVPTGAKALCSSNLPDPTIKKPNLHFNTLLYTGNDSSDRDITGVGFQPDFLWIKNRSQADWHMLQDAVRGANKVLHSNSTGVESTDNVNGHVNSFLADGFNVDAGAQGNVNENGENYVAWNWNAGGSTVTNNDGSVASQVRANTSAGFSIVTYTGDNASATVGHGLGVAPKVVMVKRRNGTGDWIIGHDGLASNAFANNKFLKFSTNSTFTNSLVWGSQPTSTVVQIVTGSGATNLNGSSDTYVMYCFSEVAGYSKFGSYTGNGNADGTFVFTGFRPALIISKKSSGSDSWQLWDNKRDPDNLMHHRLFGNENSTESTSVNSASSQLDFYSNGFKWRGSSNDTNGNGDTYIYLAFAESPFKYARAR